MRIKLPNLVILLILTTLTAIMWVGLSVYRSLSVKPAPVVSENILRPLNPILDEAIIREIEQRVLIKIVEEPIVIEEPVPTDDINIDDLNLDLEL